jgi:4-hydroxyphenylacetate 3-monooxygenase
MDCIRGNYEDIRLGNLPTAIATGDAAKLKQFVEGFMSEHDLDGWLAPDLINPSDINRLGLGRGSQR